MSRFFFLSFVLTVWHLPITGESLIDQASRSLTTTSAEMALRVSRIIGGVQWASDYMTFSAINSSRAGGEVAFEQ